MSLREILSERSSSVSPKGLDVVDIEWEAPEQVGDGPGRVTIEHSSMDDVNVLMTEEAARRLADRIFGSNKTEIHLTGQRVHWIRGDPPHPSSGS
jgi:hypothetical protein